MSIIESIEYFPLFDAEPGDEPAGGVGRYRIRRGGPRCPDALGGAGAVVLYFYSEAKNGWGYVGVLTGSKIAGSEQVRALGSSCVAFGNSVIVGAQGDAQTPGPGVRPHPALRGLVVHRDSRRRRARPPGPGQGRHVRDRPSPIALTARTITSRSARPGAGAPAGSLRRRTGLHLSRARSNEHAPGPPRRSPIPIRPEPPPTNSAPAVAINPSGDGTGGLDGTLTLAVGAPAPTTAKGRSTSAAPPNGGIAAFQLGEPLIPAFPGSGRRLSHRRVRRIGRPHRRGDARRSAAPTIRTSTT